MILETVAARRCHEVSEAFKHASAFCSPASEASRQRCAQHNLPVPHPPVTRLAPPRSARSSGRPLSVGEISVALDQPSRKSKEQPSVDASLPAAVPKPLPSPKRRAKGKNTAQVHPENFDVRESRFRLHRQMLQSRQIELRIKAFDRRRAASSGCKKHHDDDEDMLHVDAQSTDVTSAFGEKGFKSESVEQRDDHGSHHEVPFKILECSSQRGNFPASNLLSHGSCWQSDVGKIKDQHLTFELEIMPMPVTAVSLGLVTKELSPKRCKLMYSMASAQGPWNLAWAFGIPDSAYHSGNFFSQVPAKDDFRHLVAPWWRLVLQDNGGSQVCTSIAAPLKLYSLWGAESVNLKTWRKTKVSLLEINFEGQDNEQPSDHERRERGLSVTYGIDLAFVHKASAEFLELAAGSDLSKANFQEWLLSFVHAKERPRIHQDRLNFYWMHAEKDEVGRVDFEEFLLFYYAVVDNASKQNKTPMDFLFPGISRPLQSQIRPAAAEKPDGLPPALVTEEEKETRKSINDLSRHSQVLQSVRTKLMAVTVLSEKSSQRAMAVQRATAAPTVHARRQVSKDAEKKQMRKAFAKASSEATRKMSENQKDQSS
eukprot:TRINITY_DN7396_c0_g1_i1.p1 TRINITY_DN7396_c0_g1~~TRINITY_DN7396_c0_g1_i1.p1  ORF type:complete len:598 (+),score=120.06 TRINITY_DN7396_c0_g1_i1:61-1854(+)